MGSILVELCVANRAFAIDDRNPIAISLEGFVEDVPQRAIFPKTLRAIARSELGRKPDNTVKHTEFFRTDYVVLEKPPSTMIISPVTNRLCKIRLSMLSATSSSVQHRLSGVYFARRSINPS